MKTSFEISIKTNKTKNKLKYKKATFKKINSIFCDWQKKMKSTKFP